MRDLGLVLRGMWFRRGISLAVLVIAALVVGGAATGPLFLRAAGESVLHDTLLEASPIGRTLNDHVKDTLDTRPLATTQQTSARKLRRLPTLDRLVGRPVASEEVAGPGAEPGLASVGARGVTPGPAPFAYRQGVCAHVRLVRGRCASRPGTVLVSTGTATSQRWRVGQRLSVNGRPVRVSGIYAPLDPTGDYWAGHPYFAALSRSGSAGDLGSTVDALFASRKTLEDQPQATLITGAVDRRLDVSRVRLTDLTPLTRDLLSYTDAGSVFNGGEDLSDRAIVAVLGQASTVKDKLTTPVVVVEGQLLLLCWLILFLVVANAAESRGQEVALAKLRGLPASSTVAFGLLDTLLLVALAVPLGLGLGWGWVSLLADLQLAPGTHVTLTPLAALAAVGAGAGAATAAVLAASRTLRRPVVEQWRRAAWHTRPRSWSVDTVVAVAALAGLVALARPATVGPADRDELALLTPGLVVLTAALLGSRLLPPLCRSSFEPTRRRGRVGTFLAVRQLGRRPSTLRLAVVLTVAFGLVTFGIEAWTVARGNQHDRAWTEVGAARVVTVTPPPGEDVGAIVNRLDPSGREAAAVSTTTDYHRKDPVQVLAVQPERFARVAFWRQDFGAASLRTLTDRLTTETAPQVTLSGDRIEVEVTSTQLTKRHPLVLVADVAQQGAGRAPVDLGVLRPGGRVLSAELPCAAHECRLSGLHLDRQGTAFYPLTARLVVHGVRVHRPDGWQTVTGDLRRRHAWRAAGGGAQQPSDSPQGLSLRAHSRDIDVPTWQVADHPTVLPVLMTRAVSAAGRRQVDGVGSDRLSVAPVSVGPALPGTGAFGVVVDRTYARRHADGSTTAAVETVWLAPSASVRFTKRHEKAGVTVLSSSSARRSTTLYERRGPALAILLFLAGAALAALLAAGGAVLNLHLAGRRRTYEVAALSALGVRRRTLLLSLVAEQALLLLFGIGVGVAAGLVGALLALPHVPEFADNPMTPPQLYGVHAGPLVVTIGVVVALLAAVIVLSSANLLRGSRYEQLREAPA